MRIYPFPWVALRLRISVTDWFQMPKPENFPPSPTERMSALRQSLQAGSASFGAWQCLPSSLSAEILARSGFDWILIDLQHGGASWSDLLSIVQAVELGGAIPMVRLGWNDPMQVMRALDLGACGVVIPMISTPADARQGAASCRYPPDGIRSFGPTRSFYTARTLNKAALCLAMIETKEGLESVDAIAATPGIDGLFVGTMDLALSLGCGVVAGVAWFGAPRFCVRLEKNNPMATKPAPVTARATMKLNRERYSKDAPPPTRKAIRNSHQGDHMIM